MNLNIPNSISITNKTNQLSIYNKYLNKTNTDSFQNNLINTIKAYNKSDINNSYTYNYTKNKKQNSKDKKPYDPYSRNMSNNLYGNNNYYYNKKKQKPIVSLKKFINLKVPKTFNNENNKCNKNIFKPGMYSFKTSDNNNNNNNNAINQRNLQLPGLQMENLSNIKKNNNSSTHHINSNSSLNLDLMSNYNFNDIINSNNIKNLSLKNKINDQNNKLNNLDETQENKNKFIINKSTKSTKSRSLDLSKYIIRSAKDIKNNNPILTKNSISPINKKNSSLSMDKRNNKMEEASFEMILSNQDSLQLQKLKSNEFDDFDNYKDKNLNNEYNIINFMKEKNNEYDYNKESRRLIIEYLKIIKKKFKHSSLEEICTFTNISKDILNLRKDNREKNIDLSLNNNHVKKVSFLNFLSTPRIMFLLNNETNEKMPYIFNLSPNLRSIENGIESYYLKWSNMKNLSDKTSYDLSHLKTCKLKDKDYNKFYMIFQEYDCIEKNENNTSTFIIDALSYELASNYVKGLQFLMNKE